MKKIFYSAFVGSGFSFLSFFACAQTGKADTLLTDATLKECVQYAEKHYPLVQQALLDERITEAQIKSRLADWYPQLNLDASYQYNFQLSKIFVNGAYSPTGTKNASIIGLGATQNIFNRDVLLASRTANDVRTQIRQSTTTDKIDVAVNVSKAFYDVLLTQKQIEVLTDDILRLERNLKDSYNQYEGGLVDKTDYKRATISLNNSKAEKKADEELLKAKYIYLKQQMGYTANNDIHLAYDSAMMEAQILVDTTTGVNFENRIEYQSILTQKRLQEANLKYNKWSYYPVVSANGAYNTNFFNNSFSKLYSSSFPNSYAGLTLAFPIFQGGKRIQDIRIAALQVERVDWDIVNLRNSISSQYAQALAVYKGNLNDYYVLKENLELARDVFNTIELQYRSGIKAYLDLITAETDLRNAQSNYSNALYQVLSSKLDVQKALGIVQLN
ncbi:MAG TPA: TolC family protein [Puia sp.]|nr:TolC family protein [Puia sp.]